MLRNTTRLNRLVSALTKARVARLHSNPLPKPKLFLRVQQNTCSSSVESIPFFERQHLAAEKGLIQKATLGKKQIIVVDRTISADLSEIATEIMPIEDLDLAHPPHNVSLFLSQPEWIQKMFAANIGPEVYVLRHEGDFNIQGKGVACDCSHCLIQFFNPSKIPFDFQRMSDIHYSAGNQYTLLSYQKRKYENPELVPKRGCKLNPPVIKPLSFTQQSPHKISQFSASHAVLAYHAYRKLGSPKYFRAPMIGQSELAIRMLAREQGHAHVCSTQMIVSSIFLSNKEYRDEMFATCAKDRPLVVQLAGNNPEEILQAAKLVEDHCDAIDINLGCPQPVGRRHHYGSWLMEDWNLVHRIVSTLKENLKIPVWCKIRIFESLEDTLNYAKMIESAGCSLLTVHGRLRKCNMNDAPPNFEYIRAIKQALHIPVVANGGIVTLQDAEKCLQATGCDGVMAASGILPDPLLYSPTPTTARQKAFLYLEYAKKYNAPMQYVIAHIMQIVKNHLTLEIEQAVKQCQTISEMRNVLSKVDFNVSHKKSDTNTSAFSVLFDSQTPAQEIRSKL